MMGHRKSIDIYLFTSRDFDTEILWGKLESDFDFSMDFIGSLNYFKDVNLADWPELLKKKELSWTEIKKSIDKVCKDYIKTIS